MAVLSFEQAAIERTVSVTAVNRDRIIYGLAFGFRVISIRERDRIPLKSEKRARILEAMSTSSPARSKLFRVHSAHLLTVTMRHLFMPEAHYCVAPLPHLARLRFERQAGLFFWWGRPSDVSNEVAKRCVWVVASLDTNFIPWPSEKGPDLPWTIFLELYDKRIVCVP